MEVFYKSNFDSLKSTLVDVQSKSFQKIPLPEHFQVNLP